MGAPTIMLKTFLMCASIVGITQCFPRDTRSVTPVEITFFPGLTEGSKDAVVFEQWRRFLEEEEAELAREESVALKLIQQEKSSLIEPIEYATQKRLLHQFKGSKKHRQDIQNNEQGLNNVIGTVEEERQHLEYINDIHQPLEIVLIGPEDIENTAYSFDRIPHQGKPDSEVQTTHNPLNSLHLPSIPNETVSRLLGDAPGAHSSSRPITMAFPEADPVQVDRLTNITSTTFPSSNHEEEKNKRIQEIIKNQQQILEKDLNFLLEDERGSTDGPTAVPYNTSKNPSSSDVDSISAKYETPTKVNAQKWTKEEQIDWEENHEFDA